MRHVHDVIITGAGPAGCAAARTLANADFSVGLFDKAVFLRDKTCGDALIPDAHHVLKKLDLMERVTNISCPAKGMRLIGFDGSNVLIRADSACGRRHGNRHSCGRGYHGPIPSRSHRCSPNLYPKYKSPTAKV
ncbi:NAD(P)-binding protein [Nitrosospira sp. Nsp1]|uniref:NAD(P)/FAD-dependent oxidoreductase n=1 Tax=Nitrosospira sp. Nsp1 TaxID=136547 RepID=UPI00115FFF5F